MKNKQAFTLIELLVVVLIIGILAAVALPQYQMAVAKSRAANLMVIADSIVRAEEVYYLANGTYTNQLDELDIDFSNVNDYASGGNISISLRLQGPGVPDSVVVADRRFSHMHLWFGFQSTTFNGWAGWRTCYALQTDSKANVLCKHIANNASRIDSGGGYWVYTLK